MYVGLWSKLFGCAAVILMHSHLEEGAMSDGKEVGRWIYYTDNGNVNKELDHD